MFNTCKEHSTLFLTLLKFQSITERFNDGLLIQQLNELRQQIEKL